MCQFCGANNEGRARFSMGFGATGMIERKDGSSQVYIGIDYDAYSSYSSFDSRDVWVEIKFCPFCGEKFNDRTLDIPLKV